MIIVMMMMKMVLCFKKMYVCIDCVQFQFLENLDFGQIFHTKQ